MIVPAFAVVTAAAALHARPMSKPVLPSRLIRATTTVMAVNPDSEISKPVLAADCAAVALYSLQVSAIKALAVAAGDLTSPSFDLADDIASFDVAATMSYVGIEQFGAACLALGWLIGGAYSGACSERWRSLTVSDQYSLLLRGWAVAAPLACILKYSVLCNIHIPVLGHSPEAALLEAQLAGFTAGNVLTDVFGILGALALWRQVMVRNNWFL